jgi:hemolysin activation/secretion protein
LGAEFYYSPGGLTGNNSDFDFNMLRTATKADYMYGRANLERITKMPYDFSWVVKVWGQLASDRMLPSEQLALGGYSTVRGYDERVVTGDDALIVNNEIRTPPMFPINWAGFQKGIDGLQLLGFFDFGAVRQVHVLPQDGANPNPVLYSTGVGLRYTLSKNLSFRFDYGFPLTDKSLNEFSSRGHVGVLISF